HGSPIMNARHSFRTPAIFLAALAISGAALCGEFPWGGAAAFLSAPAQPSLPAACPAPGTVQLTLLRNAAITSLNPVTPPQRAITFPRPGGGAMIGGARAGVVLMADGSVWNWGADFGFRLGQGNTAAADLYLPAPVHGPGNAGLLNSITAIAAGEPFSMALK